MRPISDWDSLPPMFPTHRHGPEFWEWLGRTIATYGFLEEMLGKAIFALTATRQYSREEVDAAYQAWTPQLERALTDQLWNLAESYGKAVKDNPDATIPNCAELVDALKKAAVWRNALCHGSWGVPDKDGASVPFFVSRRMEVFDSSVDVARLQQIQTHVAELACCIIESVTHMGWQFPGGVGPGKPIMGAVIKFASDAPEVG